MGESKSQLVALPAGVTAVTHADQATWLQARQQSLGASEAPIVLGLSRFKSPYQLWAEKLGLAERGPAESEAAEWGLLLEEPISQRYARDTKRRVEAPPPYTILKREQYPIASTTLDRLTLLDTIWVPLEIKTAHLVLAKHWAEELPLEYMVQVQQQMMIWGSAVASIAALIGGNTFLWADVAADLEFQQMLYEQLQQFWALLQKREPPPMDGMPGTREVLKKLYATETGEVIALPSDALDWDEKIAELKAQQKVLGEELSRHENLMIQAIGNASAGVLPNGTVWSYKTQSRAEHFVKASTFRVLRRHAGKETR